MESIVEKRETFLLLEWVEKKGFSSQALWPLIGLWDTLDHPCVPWLKRKVTHGYWKVLFFVLKYELSSFPFDVSPSSITQTLYLKWSLIGFVIIFTRIRPLRFLSWLLNSVWVKKKKTLYSSTLHHLYDYATPVSNEVEWRGCGREAFRKVWSEAEKSS